MTIYHVRPRDLHAPGEHCNSYDCTSVVMKHEHDALAADYEKMKQAYFLAHEQAMSNGARLAEAERLLSYARPLDMDSEKRIAWWKDLALLGVSTADSAEPRESAI